MSDSRLLESVWQRHCAVCCRYGRKGIDLLEQTHGGNSVFLIRMYGEEMMQYIQRWLMLTLIKTYGDQILTAIRPLTAQLSLYMQKLWQRSVQRPRTAPWRSSLLPGVSGEDLLVYAARTLLIFSALSAEQVLAMNAFRRDDQRTADLARQYGDNVIYAVGVQVIQLCSL